MSNDLSIGQVRPTTDGGDFNQISFVIHQALSKMQTCTLVKIISCTNAGGVSPVGTVDVQPMVNQIDGFGNAVEHSTIFNIPYFRAQGGANAIIMDPQAGDIGICVFSSRDISKIKSTKSTSNPDSYRQFSYSDGLYIGGVLNGAPTQYVQFNTDLIAIHSTGTINMTAQEIDLTAPVIKLNASTSVAIDSPTITLHGAVQQTGGADCTFSAKITATGDVIGQGTSLHTHTHQILGTQVNGAPFPVTPAPI